MAADDGLVELRGEILADHAAILDVVVQATPGASRMSVLRVILAEWCEREIHRSTMVVRVAQGNGIGTETRRNRGGKGA